VNYTHAHILSRYRYLTRRGGNRRPRARQSFRSISETLDQLNRVTVRNASPGVTSSRTQTVGLTKISIFYGTSTNFWTARSAGWLREVRDRSRSYATIVVGTKITVTENKTKSETFSRDMCAWNTKGRTFGPETGTTRFAIGTLQLLLLAPRDGYICICNVTDSNNATSGRRENMKKIRRGTRSVKFGTPYVINDRRLLIYSYTRGIVA